MAIIFNGRACSLISRFPFLNVAQIRYNRNEANESSPALRFNPPRPVYTEQQLNLEPWHSISNKVNSQLEQNTVGRLFAVVMAAGKQRKVTTEDIIVLDKPITADIGEKIVLNKVLLVGGSDFTLLGRPLLRPDVVRVEATVIEKPLSRSYISFWYKKRTSIRHFSVTKRFHTYLRINEIKLLGIPETEDKS